MLKYAKYKSETALRKINYEKETDFIHLPAFLYFPFVPGKHLYFLLPEFHHISLKQRY